MPEQKSVRGGESAAGEPVRTDRSIIWFLGLAVLALIAAATSASRSTARLLSADAAREQSQQRLVELTLVLDAVVDAETGSRGYVITGDTAFLAPYRSGRSVSSTELDRLAVLYAMDSGRTALIRRVRDGIDAHRVHLAQTVAARRNEGFTAAQALVASGRGRILVDSIRQRVGSIIADEQRELREQRVLVADATRLATRNLLLLYGLTLSLFALAVAGLWRENRRRREANAQVTELNRTLESRVADIRAELVHSEGRLREALDGLLEGCAILDRDLRYRYVNHAAATQGRSTVQQMVGRTMYEVYPGFESTELHATMRRALETQRTQVVTLEFEFPNSASGWFELHLAPVAEGIFALSVERTDRVQAERALQSSEGRFRALLESLPEQVFLLDAQGVVIDLHVPDATTAPRPPHEMRSRPLAESMPVLAGAVLQSALDRAARTGRAQTVQYDIDFADKPRRFEAMVVPTEGERFTVVSRDISARQELEAQLRQSQKMEAVGQLTGGIAHDFNNVLTIIGGNAEMLAMAHAEAGTQHDELSEIVRATRRGADMIAQLLSFSRRGMLKRQHTVVPAAIRPFVSMLERLLPATIKLELGPLDTTDPVLLDTGAFEQMLANLCTNARDAMPDGGVIRINCERTWLDAGYHATHPWVVPGPYVCVSVSDTGIGMDEATRLRVFEPFYTTKPAGVGTGLGMAMVYGIMKEHEGMVHVYSEVGRGTVINLYFPVDETAPEKRVSEQRTDFSAISGGGETILLAEDDAAIRLATRRALQLKGYVILDAADGEQALALFRAHPGAIDLVITDLIMPNLGGRQLVEALRAEGSMVPVLFTSGYSSEDIYRQGELPPRVGFLHKPWTLTELFTRAREILDGVEEFA